MFDIQEFFSVSIAGVPLIFVVIGLVQWLKSMGLAGNPLRIVSMGVGLVLGGGYQLSQLGMQTTFSGWFAVAVYGLALGIVASGNYDAIKNILKSNSAVG